MSENDGKNLNREKLIEILVDNLVPLRAKSGLTQSDLADSVGIGRQTLLAIENKRGKLRWDTFLAIVIVFSQDSKTNEYMKFLGLDLKSIQDLIQEDILNKKGGMVLNFEKLWTDYESTYDIVKAICPLPTGLQGSTCPKCGSKELTGAIIAKDADGSDPNILCKQCGYWRD